jgi:hypothetical protein
MAMHTGKDYPAGMQLPLANDTGVAPTLRVTPHAFALATTLFLSWFYVLVAAELYGRAAYSAAEQQDFSGLGAARAEFDFQLFCLPILGFATYWIIRLVIGGSRSLWKMANRKH